MKFWGVESGSNGGFSGTEGVLEVKFGVLHQSAHQYLEL